MDKIDNDIIEELDMYDNQKNNELDNFSSDNNLGLSSNDMDGLYGADISTMDKHDELLKNLTNFEPYLQDKFFQWSATYWDKDKRKLLKDDDFTPIMNIRGAKYFISYLQTYVRGNNVITVLDAKTYQNAMNDTLKTTVHAIAEHYETFQIHSSADQSRILDEMENSVALILSGSYAGQYNKFLGGAYKAGSHETFGNANIEQGQYPQQQKRSMWGKAKSAILGQ